jgi:acetyl esterase/lipase
VVAGESAGGNLCLELMLSLRDAGEALPAAAALISPWLDLAATSASYVRNADADFGTREMLLSQARDYAGHLPLTDPRISPANAKLRGLPPLLVQCGSAELLHDECVQFAERARAEGVDVALDVLRDMTHAAPLFAELAPEAGRGRANVARFVQEHACRASG